MAEGKFATDLEAKNQPIQRFELRWGFFYGILIFELVLSFAVYSVLIYVQHHPIKHIFITSHAGQVVYISILVFTCIVWVLLHVFEERHSINFILLTLFAVSISFTVGLVWPLLCPFANGRVILESMIITTVLVMSLTLCTFWAARKGHDFRFLLAFSVGTAIVLLVCAMIQIFLPGEKIVPMISKALCVINFSGCIVYTTDNLIKRFPKMNTYELLFLYGPTSFIFLLILTHLGVQGDN
ncbi:protein LIFEGUARD 4-like [Tasmannia lanceolata]|uniref:protein LIFEGUARD 4-like n=1 Tax=Tasmannia lanceolata TaxID=3420 RepID=UPI00406485CB